MMAHVLVRTELYREHYVAELGVVVVKYWLQCLIPFATTPTKAICGCRAGYNTVFLTYTLHLDLFWFRSVELPCAYVRMCVSVCVCYLDARGFGRG